MAIEIKTIDGWKAAAACGVGSSAIESLQGHGVTVMVQPSMVSFMKGKEKLAAFMCKSAIIADAANGVIQPNAGLQAAFKNSAAMALTAMAADKPVPVSEMIVPKETQSAAEVFAKMVEPDAPKPSVLDLLVKNKDSKPESFVAAADIFPATQMLNADTVPLAQATMLYQPVDGSSGGSRYFVVAMRADLKVAARYLKNGKLSVRVEGSGLAKHEQSLDAAGFSGGKEYRSLHLVPGQDIVMAGRTLGSVLMGMNIDFSTVTPKIGVIAGKGN